MKPVLVLSLIVAASFAGFVGATAAVVLGVGASSQNQPVVATPNAVSHSTADSKNAGRNDAIAMESAALRHDLDDLSTQLTAMRSELAMLRTDIARQATPSAAPELVVKADELAAVQRDAVVKILQEQKDLEQKKRDEERKARDLQQIKDRAARAAKELGLGTADESRLVDFMTVASAKRDEMFAGTRDGNFDRDTMRKSFEDYRTWTETELKAQFGADLAEQLLKLQRDSRGGGWGGDFGGGGQPNWGGQGQNGQPGQGSQQRGTTTQTKQGQ